ncbi:MAG: hypothetical protein NZ523_01555, partial [Elioraea sp.]|nr:hypothetical protein [Elioraea sp.]
NEGVQALVPIAERAPAAAVASQNEARRIRREEFLPLESRIQEAALRPNDERTALMDAQGSK